MRHRTIDIGAVRALGAAMLLAAIFLLILDQYSAAIAQDAAADSIAADSAAVAQSPAAALNPAWEFINDLFGISTEDLSIKALRILAIVLIVAVARLFMILVQKVSHFLVYSNWGPLRYIFSNHQRSITLQNLLISLTKYVVYIMAMGYILRELGVDYRAYLASLSLIGIALGFGSQGLVQDVVTGFFILFENQFSVGDMVEISGQVGVVESIGLRTTRIHNYFGASIVLQNRNIPMAIRYPKGAFEVVIDVAIPSTDAAVQAATLLDRVGTELHKQFREIIMRKPQVKDLVELETSELFARLYCEIWPAQQWVIEAQMVPRIRELFKREGLEVPADRIVVFYHLPEERGVEPSILGNLSRIRRSNDPADYDEIME